MKRGISKGLAGVAGILALSIAVPILLPASHFKEQIEQIATGATGRVLTISGPLHLSILPRLAIHADHVALGNLPGFRTHNLATAESVYFGVRLWPLLFGKVEITRIVLERANANLEVNAQGRANWLAPRGSKATHGHSAPHPMAQQFSGIEIAHGRVGYTDVRSGRRFFLDDVSAHVDITKSSQPIRIQGAFRFSNRFVTFTAKAASPELLLDEHKAAVDISLKSELLRLSFKGHIDPSGTLDGISSISTNSVRAAGTWLGARIPESGGLGQFSLQSHITGDDRHMRLANMTMTLDGMKAAGSLALDTSQDRPHVRGAITIDRLDLNPYIERPQKPRFLPTHSDKDDWSDRPLTLALLEKANAELTLDVGTLTIRKLLIAQSHIAVNLNSAVLNARLDPISLYGGTGSVILRVDARATPVFRSVVALNGLDLQPFLARTLGVQQIEGRGSIELDVASRGDSADAIMHGLYGKGLIDFHNGQLRGVDLGAVARTLQGLIHGAIEPDAFTKYSTMRGTFVLSNGVLSGSDFQLTGPVLHTTGAGAVDIGNRAIDFKIVPEASAVIVRQKLSIGLPFRITGPWNHVHYRIDLNGVVDNVLNNLKSVRAPFRNLFGSSKPKDPNAPKKKHKKIGDALKNMLGIH